MRGRRFYKLRLLYNNLLHERASYHQPDIFIIALVFIIVAFGMIMLSSASSAVSYARYQSSYYYFNHQLFGLGLGVMLFYGLSRIDYHIYRNKALLLLVGSLGLLLLVFIPAISAGWGHSRSWINVFGFSLQPSEF